MIEYMICDKCGLDSNEVIVLRENRFIHRESKEARRFRRVCLACAEFLARTKRYNFGLFWKGILTNWMGGSYK